MPHPAIPLRPTRFPARAAEQAPGYTGRYEPPLRRIPGPARAILEIDPRLCGARVDNDGCLHDGGSGPLGWRRGHSYRVLRIRVCLPGNGRLASLAAVAMSAVRSGICSLLVVDLARETMQTLRIGFGGALTRRLLPWGDLAPSPRGARDEAPGHNPSPRPASILARKGVRNLFGPSSGRSSSGP
jgi:hypothetical protein